MKRDLRSEEGFTLIEVAMAVAVFGVVMIGMSVMFTSAFDTTGQARSAQFARTIAQEKLEEVRHLPFYESQRVTTRDVDVLDRYFPGTANRNPTATGAVGTYDATANVWTYTSRSTVTKPQAPTYTVRVAVQFVQVATNGSLTPVAPIANYNSDVADRDNPATDTVKVVVTVSWTQGTRARSVVLDTLVARVKQQPPRVEASGSFAGLEIAGVQFRDGDVGGVDAEVLARFGIGTTDFREITDSSSQATARPVQVIERRVSNSVDVQAAQPTAGSAGASVPNSTTGTTQTSNTAVPSGTMTSVNLPAAVIASWCTQEGDNCLASTQAQVHTRHDLDPEGRAQVLGRNLLVNGRQSLEGSPHRMLQAGQVSGTITQSSTTAQSRVTSTVTVNDITVWASTSFLSNPRYQGTVRIGRLELTVQATAGASPSVAENVVEWRIDNLRVWDPNRVTGQGVGGYGDSYTFGFRSSCGRWVGAPPGEPGHSCAPPYENPNPVVIPAAYAGVIDGQATTSLSIVAGSTIQERSSNAAQQIANANTSQKSVITIITRDDVTGAAALRPSTTTLGNATAKVAYVGHQH